MGRVAVLAARRSDGGNPFRAAAEPLVGRGSVGAAAPQRRGRSPAEAFAHPGAEVAGASFMKPREQPKRMTPLASCVLMPPPPVGVAPQTGSPGSPFPPRGAAANAEDSDNVSASDSSDGSGDEAAPPPAAATAAPPWDDEHDAGPRRASGSGPGAALARGWG